MINLGFNLDEWIGKEKQKIIIAENIIKNILNSELYDLWQDIKMWNEKAIISEESHLYKLREDIRKTICDTEWDNNYSITISNVMKEIAKAHYNER